ncbi:MAG: histidine phosphatase family protein [Calditrichaeota bacterium]|nr:MAG: histidine phosphatase family protein [Calditrichota bacterium]
MENKIKTQLIVVRHGQTEWNAVDRFQGHLDTNLSDLGEKQAKALASRIKDFQVEAIYSSDLKRAHSTAKPIAEKLELSITTDERLRERHMGIFQGLTFAEIAQKFPSDYKKFMTWDPDYIIPQGESARQKHDRTMACFNEIADDNLGKEILVVSHGGTIDALFRHALELKLSQPRKYKNFNASINRFFRLDDTWMLATWGEISHMLDHGLPISQSKNASL